MIWLWVGVWGGLVALDTAAFPQVMISRPLVAGAITGLLFGRPVEGVVIGAFMEIFSLAVLPAGAARYPEAGTATVAAAAGYLLAIPEGLGAAVLLAVVFGLLWEFVTGASVRIGRRLNEGLLALPSHARAPDLTVERTHLAAMFLDFARGCILSIGGAILGAAFIAQFAARIEPFQSIAWGALTVAAAFMAGSALSLIGLQGERRWGFLLGIAAGLLMWGLS